MRISSPARPGRRPVRSEPRWPSRPDVAWDWNLTDQVEHGPVIWKYHGLGPARSVRPGSAPPAKDGPTRKDRWIWNTGLFTIWKYHETWHKTWHISYFRQDWNVMNRNINSLSGSNVTNGDVFFPVRNGPDLQLWSYIVFHHMRAQVRKCIALLPLSHKSARLCLSGPLSTSVFFSRFFFVAFLRVLLVKKLFFWQLVLAPCGRTAGKKKTVALQMAEFRPLFRGQNHVEKKEKKKKEKRKKSFSP